MPYKSIILLNWCLLLLFFAPATQAQTFKKGNILDSISVGTSEGETFAMYLPKSYAPNELNNILFIFEPAARGKVGVSTFMEAAEKYNYILVCSNNSRNGPYERNFGIANRLFDHIFTNFNINEKSIYLAGFSGGSRLASSIACLTDQVAGVIACGAAFSGASAHTPSTQDFAYAAICGDRDMNYTEMINAKGYLQQIGFNHTLFTFDGDHQWPPPQLIDKAFTWLQIQAHKKGALSLTREQLSQQYQASYAHAKLAEKNKEPLAATETYERILTTYGDIFKTDSILEQLQRQRKSKAYKQEIKDVAKAFEKEKTFADRFQSDYEKADTSRLSWWKKELGKLHVLQASSDGQMRKMISRIQFKVYAMAISRNNPLLHQSTKEQQEFCKAIGQMVYTEKQE